MSSIHGLRGKGASPCAQARVLVHGSWSKGQFPKLPSWESFTQYALILNLEDL